MILCILSVREVKRSEAKRSEAKQSSEAGCRGVEYELRLTRSRKGVVNDQLFGRLILAEGGTVIIIVTHGGWEVKDFVGG